MLNQPTLETPRLILRPLRLSDAREVQYLAGDPDIARTTIQIPHPYPDGAAEEWIASLPDKFDQRREVNFAVTLKRGKGDRSHLSERPEGGHHACRVVAQIEPDSFFQLIGAVCLRLELEHDRGEVGYWIGKSFWGQGYATEAARAVVSHGLEFWRLNRIVGGFFASNPASGRVLQKLGFQPEGRMRQHIKKWGRYEDLEIYAVLRSEWIF
jgi:ribosomal-protein-alanine N-acetyltransferase